MIQGNQPCQTGTSFAARASIACLAIANSGSGAGFQTRRKPSVTISDPSEASTSVKV